MARMDRIAFSCLLAVIHGVAYIMMSGAPPASSATASFNKTTNDVASLLSTRFGSSNHFGFPIDYVPNPAKWESSQHTLLLEENDGVFHESNCNTWQRAAGKLEWNCKIEWDEWMLSNAFVRPGDVVIEFGARYGTTSCILSRTVGKEGHVFAVEMDPLVHGYLLRNRYEHNCNFHAVLGTVSSQPLFKGRNSGYAGETTSVGKGRGLPRVTVSDLEQLVDERINVVLIDCEGCIPFVDTTGLLDETYGVDIILMEEDGLSTYAEWHSMLSNRKYRCLWYIKDTLHQTQPLAGWSKKMRHSAWAHERVLNEGEKKRELPPRCEKYVKMHGFDSRQIDCSECPV